MSTKPSKGLQYDPDSAVKHLRAVDARMAALIDIAGPFTMTPRRPMAPFPALFRAIVYQQLSGKAAGTIHQRVLDLFPGRGHPSPETFLAMDEDRLRGAGLSRNKLLAARDLAEKTASGDVPSLRKLHGMDDETVIETLLPVRGIGRWTVEMLLIFTLGRPDVLPVDDLGVRKGFVRLYGGTDRTAAKRLVRQARHWQPYRSVASWYLWRATELPADVRFD
jgi:3-methyladenine DNA glycosylase/8-oxoguanine DNA glycosylase